MYVKWEDSWENDVFNFNVCGDKWYTIGARHVRFDMEIVIYIPAHSVEMVEHSELGHLMLVTIKTFPVLCQIHWVNHKTCYAPSWFLKFCSHIQCFSYFTFLDFIFFEFTVTLPLHTFLLVLGKLSSENTKFSWNTHLCFPPHYVTVHYIWASVGLLLEVFVYSLELRSILISSKGNQSQTVTPVNYFYE